MIQEISSVAAYLGGAIITIVLPALMMLWLAVGTPASFLEWVVMAFGVATVVLFAYTAGGWDCLGYYLRYALVAAYVIVLFLSAHCAGALPPFDSLGRNGWVGIGLTVVYCTLLAFIHSGHSKRLPGLNMTFPLREGSYYVAQGGNDFIQNVHFPSTSVKYALDIVKLNSFGFRAVGFYPKSVDRYNIFGEAVSSPVAGKIARAVDGFEDLIPPTMDRKNPLGNYLLIKMASENAFLFLAHLKKSSILVHEGEYVEAGQLLARVGNSGNTSEPHLHIHCERDVTDHQPNTGVGVPIFFDGKFLKRNDVVRSRDVHKT